MHSTLCRFVAAGSQVPELKRKLNESGYLTRPAGGGSYQRDTASDNRVSVPDRTSQRQRATHAAGTTFTPQFTTTSTRAATEHRLLFPAQGVGGVLFTVPESAAIELTRVRACARVCVWPPHRFLTPQGGVTKNQVPPTPGAPARPGKSAM